MTVRFPPLNSSRPPRNEEGAPPWSLVLPLPLPEPREPHRDPATRWSPLHPQGRLRLACCWGNRNEEKRGPFGVGFKGAFARHSSCTERDAVIVTAIRKRTHRLSLQLPPGATAHLGLFRTPNPVVLGSRGQLCLAVPRPCTFRSWRLYESSSPCLPLCHGASPRLTERMSSPTRSP